MARIEQTPVNFTAKPSSDAFALAQASVAARMSDETALATSLQSFKLDAVRDVLNGKIERRKEAQEEIKTLFRQFKSFNRKEFEILKTAFQLKDIDFDSLDGIQYEKQTNFADGKIDSGELLSFICNLEPSSAPIQSVTAEPASTQISPDDELLSNYIISSQKQCDGKSILNSNPAEIIAPDGKPVIRNYEEFLRLRGQFGFENKLVDNGDPANADKRMGAKIYNEIGPCFDKDTQWDLIQLLSRKYGAWSSKFSDSQEKFATEGDLGQSKFKYGKWRSSKELEASKPFSPEAIEKIQKQAQAEEAARTDEQRAGDIKLPTLRNPDAVASKPEPVRDIEKRKTVSMLSAVELAKYQEAVTVLNALLAQKGQPPLDKLFADAMAQGQEDWKNKKLTPLSSAYVGGVVEKNEVLTSIIRRNDINADWNLLTFWLITSGFDDGMTSL